MTVWNATARAGTERRIPAVTSADMSNEGLRIAREEIEAMWDLLLPGLPLLVFVMGSKRDRGAPRPIGLYFRHQIDRLAKDLYRHNIQLRRNVYFQLAVPNAEVFSHWTWRKLSKPQMVGATMQWVDVDGLPVDEAFEMLRRFRPRPTIIMFSGSGVWGFWRLRNGDLFTDESAVRDFEARNRWLARSLKGGDSCHNVERIGRLPGTWNWPTPRKIARGRTGPELARILEVLHS